MNIELIVMPIGMAGIELSTKLISLTCAMKIKLTRMLDGRLVIKPPILVPNLSARNVAVAIHNPATKNEIVTFVKKTESINLIYNETGYEAKKN